VLAAAPAAAHAAGPDLVVSQAKAFAVAATGWKTYADVTVKNVGNRAAGASRISVRLKSGGKTYGLTPSPNAVPRLGPGKAKKLDVAARLPGAFAQGATFTLVVCADAKRDVRETKEGNNCRTSGPGTVVGPTTTDLLNEAADRGLLTLAQATLHKAEYLAGSKKLPVRYRTGAGSAGGDPHDAAVELAATFPHLPAAAKAGVGLYAVPSALRAALDGAGPPPASTLLSEENPCRFVSAIDGTVKDMTTYHKFVYKEVPAAGGKAAVWYQASRPQDADDAQAYATAIGDAWTNLTPKFKAPKSDADRQCLNAGDGRFDVYVDASIGNLAQVLPMGIWKPTGGTNGGPVEDWGSCTNTPAYMDIRPGQPRWAVAHELMHAIQFAYTYAKCGRENNWWDEGQATWAADAVYPTDDYEHQRFLEDFRENAEPVWRGDGTYDSWLFWYMLTKAGGGVATLRNVFTNLASMPARKAVNAASPGGYKQQVPRYLQWLWNGAPVGSSGFPTAKSYKGWDRIPNRPQASAERELTVGLAGERLLTVPVLRGGEGDYCKEVLAERWGFIAVGGCVDGKLGPEAGVFMHFTLPQKKVRQIEVTDGMKGKTGEHLEAWFKLADGTWKAEDWTGKKTKLCRDRESQDVRDLYLVSSNVAVDGDGFPAENLSHKLKLKDVCDLGPYDGVFSGTSNFLGPDVDFTTTFHGTAHLVPLTGPLSTGHELTVASGTFVVDGVAGTVGGCTLSSPGGTFSLPSLDMNNTPTVLVTGDGGLVALPFPDATTGNPPDLLTVPATYSGGDDCDGDLDYPLLGLGQWSAVSNGFIEPDVNGVFAADVHMSDLTWIHHFTFSFTPAP
jgi:hypothetical protein